MKKRHIIRVGSILFLCLFSLVVGHFVINKGKTDLSILSPLSKSFSILAFSSKRTPPKKIIYGYLPYWNIEEIKYLQLDKITDIAYFGLNIDAKGNFIKINDENETDPGYNNWQNSKELDKLISNCKKNNVNFALTVISHTDSISDEFLDCRDCWDNFLKNLTLEMDKKRITDVNLNFEYVEYTPKEKAHQYTEFIRFVNNKLDEKYGNSKVVVATFADSIVKDRVTIIDEVGKAADQIFIMAYDFHRPNSDNAGPVSPIGGKGVHAEYDIQTMLEDYLTLVPPSKLIMGVPYYGYNWVVESDDAMAKRVEGRDDIGFSQSQTYKAIMETILELKPVINWDELGKSPYFTYISPETGATREVYFDNMESLKVKYTLIKNKNLAGVGIWALGYDGGYKDLWDLLEKEFVE